MSHHNDNPAGRLLSVLTVLCDMEGDRSALDALLEIFGVNNDPQLAESLASLVRLPDEAADQIREMDLTSGPYLQWVGAVRDALSSLLFENGNIDTFKAHCGSNSLVSLEFCSDQLHRHHPERTIVHEHISQIKEALLALRKEVHKADDIDPEVRAFLLYHIGVMERGVRDVPLAGSASLDAAYDQMRGAFARRADLVVKIDTNSSIWAKLRDLIATASAACVITSAHMALPAPVRDLLEGRPAAIPVQVAHGHHETDRSAGSAR